MGSSNVCFNKTSLLLTNFSEEALKYLPDNFFEIASSDENGLPIVLKKAFCLARKSSADQHSDSSTTTYQNALTTSAYVIITCLLIATIILFIVKAIRSEAHLDALVVNGQQQIRKLSQRIRKKSGIEPPKNLTRVGPRNDPATGREIEMNRLGEDIGEDVIRPYRL